MVFTDRSDAATRLLPYLEHLRARDVVVLAIPRGGVPIGTIIADHFGWPLGVILTKKIGHPFNHEYAIGAVGLTDHIVEQGHEDVTPAYIEQEVARIKDLLRARQQRFAAVAPTPSLHGKVVVIIDDGIATGQTMLATIAIVRKQGPAAIIVAAPVASPSTINELERRADEVIILDTPEDFSAVGQFYEDFSEVTDEDVVRLLARAHS